METFKLNLTSLQNKIFRFLCINAGKAFNLSEIARNLKVSPTAVAKALVNLKKEEIVSVKTSETMNLLSIELKLENQKVMELKRVENLSMIYESGIISFLSDTIPGVVIVLFGSYSRGDDNSNSDIDIAIIGAKGKQLDISKFEKILKKKIVINFYNNLNNLDKNLRNNLLNGIVLSGVLQS
ncbi:MAG: nucleotidyltransferase domain-containing protein [Nanoarchaeota archaeon]|nr:nucleotidyltransferase domain-containing protein [Nanoarchaeota archaeon]